METNGQCAGCSRRDFMAKLGILAGMGAMLTLAVCAMGANGVEMRLIEAPTTEYERVV